MLPLAVRRFIWLISASMVPRSGGYGRAVSLARAAFTWSPAARASKMPRPQAAVISGSRAHEPACPGQRRDISASKLLAEAVALWIASTALRDPFTLDLALTVVGDAVVLQAAGGCSVENGPVVVCIFDMIPHRFSIAMSFQKCRNAAG